MPAGSFTAFTADITAVRERAREKMVEGPGIVDLLGA